MTKFDTKKEIMVAAGALFKSQGFSATSTREIAKKAGINLGSLHYWFSSKKAILLEMMGLGMDLSNLRLKKISESALSPKAKILKGIENHLELILGDNPYTFVLVFEWRSLDRKELPAIIKKRDTYENLWKQIIEEAAETDLNFQISNPEIFLKALMGALNWSPVWFSPEKGSLSVNQLALEIFQIFEPQPEPFKVTPNQEETYV